MTATKTEARQQSCRILDEGDAVDGHVDVGADADAAFEGACGDVADLAAWRDAPATWWRMAVDSGCDCEVVANIEESEDVRAGSIWQKPMRCQRVDGTCLPLAESAAIAVDYHRMFRATLEAFALMKLATYGSNKRTLCSLTDDKGTR